MDIIFFILKLSVRELCDTNEPQTNFFLKKKEKNQAKYAYKQTLCYTYVY